MSLNRRRNLLASPEFVSIGKRPRSGTPQTRYSNTRQTGSHLRLTTHEHGEHHLTIPQHNPLRVGTLSAILTDVAVHFDISREQLLDTLFGYHLKKKC